SQTHEHKSTEHRARAKACHRATQKATQEFKIPRLVSDEVQQAPRLSDLSARPSPASYD
ncbi:hypothetical protein CI102_15412, partial [Trichoderma harzianum]